MVALDLPTPVPDVTRLSHAYSLRAPRPMNALTRWRMQSPAPVAYETQLRPFLRERALRLPEGSNPPTHALARPWRREAGADDAAIVARALARIRSAFIYTQPPPPTGHASGTARVCKSV